MGTPNAYDVLQERGYIAQSTHPDELRDLFSKERVTFYCGFDPTASSLHVGHFIMFMVMRQLQLMGHRPIVLLGGGTGMVGDPSGRSDMRRVMTIEEIDQNCANFKKQAERFIEFGDDKGLCLNNAHWLRELNYIEFLRDIGYHFSINRMLAAECYKTRLEVGLTFTELNYMVMQSYDFLYQYRNYGCRLELGGNDQWSNIIGGVELVRRAEGESVYGLTMNLLTKSDGTKMGKTAGGAVWLDRDKMSPYEFYQYWRNVDDADVNKCFRLLTFLPIDEIDQITAASGAAMNAAKERLAYEITKLVHSEADAEEAQAASRALFSGAVEAGALPETKMSRTAFTDGYGLLQLLKDLELTDSVSQARRLVEQGGISLQDEKITDSKYQVHESDFNSDARLKIRKGKKTYHLVQLTD
ncbi:tyrosine--tRNA ligase [Peptococcus niger]|uniref:Tyrosine--tRNA ligase n=1 Tax=Peptococcus niger TaxID=2741 RepID=A0A1G6XPY0_PEPNI|nr:tyrosine--tRNA ligase [Peptococcus niger]SDD80200.1 tyrosyl-tRNA synthetase [Peptococcus niger]